MQCMHDLEIERWDYQSERNSIPIPAVFVFPVYRFVWLCKDEMFGAFAGMNDNPIRVFGLNLGLGEHSVQELGELVC